MGKRGRPKKIKKLEQYTISELREMPMGSMVKLFFGDLMGKRAVVASPIPKHAIIQRVERKRKEIKSTESPAIDPTVVAELMGMTLEKKADYLADALMGYLKKSK